MSLASTVSNQPSPSIPAFTSYIQGNVDKGGGDFVGRDKHVGGQENA